MELPQDFVPPEDINQRRQYLIDYFKQHNIANRFSQIQARRHGILDKIIADWQMEAMLGNVPRNTTVAVKRALLTRYFAGDFTPFAQPREPVEPERLPTHWLLRISDGQHFRNAYPHLVWGINSTVGTGGVFLREAQPGDIIWFVLKKTGGKLAGCAQIDRITGREGGPTDSELGWDHEPGVWDTLVHYHNFKNLTACEIHTDLKGQASVARYKDTIQPNLPTAWHWIGKLAGISDDIW